MDLRIKKKLKQHPELEKEILSVARFLDQRVRLTVNLYESTDLNLYGQTGTIIDFADNKQSLLFIPDNKKINNIVVWPDEIAVSEEEKTGWLMKFKNLFKKQTRK